MTAAALTANEVQKRVAALADWQATDLCLRKRFEFADFITAFGWMTSVALIAEKMNHHPEWKNVYRTVDVELSTHDAAGITDLDFQLAAEMDRLAAVILRG